MEFLQKTTLWTVVPMWYAYSTGKTLAHSVKKGPKVRRPKQG